MTAPTVTQPLTEQPAPPTTCVCIRYVHNQQLYGIGSCPHTTGQRDPRYAVPFGRAERWAFAAQVKADVAAQGKAVQP